MKRKTSLIWRVAVALITISSLAMVFAPSAWAAGPNLTVDISPPDGSTISACADFSVTAMVSNDLSASNAESVVVSIEVTGNATKTLGDTAQLVYDICPGYHNTNASWIVHCDGPGPAAIKVTATPANGTAVTKTVNINQICRLGVTITNPAPNTKVNVGDQFAVTAEVTNNTNTTSNHVVVTLAINGLAALQGGNLSYTVDPIEPHQKKQVNWTLLCIDPGPVELTVTADDGILTCDACAATITVQQLSLCDLVLTMGPPPGNKVCVGGTFTVTGKIKNNGNDTVTNVKAKLTKTDGMVTGSPALDSYYNVVASLAPGAEVPVSWTITCTGRTEPCQDPDWVSFTAEARATCGGSTIDAPSVDLPEYADQRYLTVKIIDPLTCHNYCLNDEFLVNAQVKNCTNKTVNGNILIEVLDPTGELQEPPPANQVLNIPASGTATVPIPWHLKCTGAGDLNIKVTYMGISGTLTVCDTDTITVHQKEPAQLDVSLDTSPCATNGDEFTVTAIVYNPGGIDGATATDITATIDPSGDVSTTEPLTKNVDDIAAGASEVVTWTFRCTGPDDASFEVSVSGMDAICDTPLSAEAGPVDTEQLDLGVQITSPEPCSIFHVSDTFCVTATVADNDGDTDYSGLTATISFPGGGANIVMDEEYTKVIADLADGDTQEVSWTVHCENVGDANIVVEVSGMGDSCSVMMSDEITVHQVSTGLSVSILSPYMDIYITTSQDFALTATITNNGEIPITIDSAVITSLGGGISSGAPTPNIIGMELAPLEQVTVSWTVHCESSGSGPLMLTVSGTDTLGRSSETYEFSPDIYIYPAAHLEVEILSVTPSTIHVCDMFEVRYRVTNTGEADAWEASATLSAFPEGSVRIQEGQGGYTQNIGTLVGHGQDGYYEGTFYLHCKEACESTITITAAGNDEFGWHWDCTPWGCGWWVLPGFAIDSSLIEPASVTVKQLPGEADLEITKDAAPDTATMGGSVTFTVTLTNNGPSNTTSVRVTDLLPAGLSYSSSIPSQGWYDVTSGVWDVGDLAEGASVTLEIEATVNTVGDVTNRATITVSVQHDPDTGNNSATATVTGEEAPPVENATININKGYNLISLPLIPEDKDIEDVLDDVLVPDVLVVKVTMYDASVPDWYLYTPGAPSDLDTMEDGWGYWILMNAAASFSFDGWELVAETDPPSLPPSYPVVSGWNLIGFKSTVAKTPTDYLAGIAGKYVMIYGYKNGMFFVVGSPGHAYLEPSLGYWLAIKTGESGIIYP